MSGVIGAKDSAYFTHKNLFIDKKKKLCALKVYVCNSWKHENCMKGCVGIYQVNTTSRVDF
jgi:hypothetical protein